MRFCAGTKRLQNGASFFSETAYFFPLSFPLTAFSEFYGILRASLESLENTTLFRRAFTPFYTPSLIQVPPRAPEMEAQGFSLSFFFAQAPNFGQFRQIYCVFALETVKQAGITGIDAVQPFCGGHRAKKTQTIIRKRNRYALGRREASDHTGSGGRDG